MNTVFCTKEKGHVGLHKGFRKLWDVAGRVWTGRAARSAGLA